MRQRRGCAPRLANCEAISSKFSIRIFLLFRGDVSHSDSCQAIFNYVRKEKEEMNKCKARPPNKLKNQANTQKKKHFLKSKVRDFSSSPVVLWWSDSLQLESFFFFWCGTCKKTPKTFRLKLQKCVKAWGQTFTASLRPTSLSWLLSCRDPAVLEWSSPLCSRASLPPLHLPRLAQNISAAVSHSAPWAEGRFSHLRRARLFPCDPVDCADGWRADGAIIK